ncbi:hypothetical protein KAR91_13725 [Candidatus Pacearchaeota archaeon]|nr:hypothetical protein [Candidatus Pacearchaeota archaeon]
MSYLWVSRTMAKHNPKTGKWDMRISLAWNKPFVKMSFDSAEDANKFASNKMKEMHEKADKDRRTILR